MVILVLLLVAATLLALGLWMRRADAKRLADAKAWPSVPGRITRSAAVTRGQMMQDVLELQDRDADDRRGFRVDIACAYSVGGRDYVGRKIRPNGSSFNSEDDANAAAARYPEGATPPVYYKADKPEVAFLEAQSSYVCVWPLLLAAFVCIVAGSTAFAH